MTEHAPTDEQLDIVSAATHTEDNLQINALAGTGKTTTLEMIQAEIKTKPILYLAFGAKIVKEAEKKFPSTTTIRTFNSMGHRVWAAGQAKNLVLNKAKSNDIYTGIINETPKAQQGILWDVKWDVINAVGLAKALGYIPEGKFPHAKPLISQAEFHASLEEPPDDLTSDLIDAVLTRSIKAAYEGLIDYNDQIYMPALFGGTFPRFPLVFVDEAQDLSPINHALLQRLVKHRLISVGDPWQNIYGFRGATAGGMQSLQAQYSMTEFDLSISFRCPEAVVRAARWRVPQFKWIKPGGEVGIIPKLDGRSIRDDATIICRNNAPLFRVALNLLSAGRSVSVAGSDIGPKLIAIMRKLGPGDLSQASTVAAIHDWLEEKLAKGSTTAQDLADCMLVFASFGPSLALAISYAEHLFAQKGTTRLLTGHKAKGLEFETVYFLDPWLLGADEQDLNLKYVIQTRSMNRLFEINSRDISWA